MFPLVSIILKVDDLDVGKWKFVPVDFKRLSNVVANEIVKNTKLKTLKTKLNSLEKKFLMQLH